MLTSNEIIDEIERNKEKIRLFGVTALTLVGSYARNEANENSDIDFVVEFAQGRGLFDDYVHLVQFLEDLFKKKIEVGERKLIKKELEPFILEGKKIEAKI
jgi:uncharacterized protein